MGIRIRPHTVASLTFSVATLMIFLFLSLFFREQLILYLGIPFALGAFFLPLMILDKDGNKVSIVLPALSRFKIFLFGLAIFSVFAVLFLPAFDGSMLEWMKISPLNWLRYLSSLLLTSFLPGYLLLKIVDRKDEVSGCIVIVSSYLLSLFISFIVGFFVLLSANSISSLGLPIIVATNLTLIVIYYFTDRINATNRLLTLNLFEFGLILSTFVVIMVGSIAVMINNMPLTSGDMWRHHGIALQYSKGFPVYGGKLITYQGGYLFHIYLAVVFTLSGIPSALAEQGLYILSFMPVLAFYSTARMWFSGNEEKLPVIATFLSILLGFGSLYAIFPRVTQPGYSIIQILNDATSKTYDIYMRVLYLPDIVAPFWNIGLPVFFTLLYFMRKHNYNVTRFVLIPILVSLGWLGHVSEIVFFILILLIYTLFIRGKDEPRSGPYVVLGLLLVIVIDFAAPARVYIFSVNGTPSLPFFSSLFVAMLINVGEILKERNFFQFSLYNENFSTKLKVVWRYVRWILLYIYIFSFVIWLGIEKAFDLWTWGGYDYTPFFVFPLRLGATGLFAMISIFLYLPEITREKHLLFFLLLIPLGLALEQAANYNILPYPAYRFATLTFVGSLPVAAYGIMRIMNGA